MTQSEFLWKLATKFKTQEEAHYALDAIFDTLKECLEEVGSTVKLMEFGTFKRVRHKARRYPAYKNSEQTYFDCPPREVIKFVPSNKTRRILR